MKKLVLACAIVAVAAAPSLAVAKPMMHHVHHMHMHHHHMHHHMWGMWGHHHRHHHHHHHMGMNGPGPVDYNANTTHLLNDLFMGK